MKKKYSREVVLRIAAEKMRLKKEKEEREDKEFYERMTSGTSWLIFKTIVVFSTLMLLVTTFEFFVDGPTKKLTEEDWKIDRNWEWTWHKVLDVEGYMFSPLLNDWVNKVDSSLEITYSPIFRTGKKLSYDVQVNGSRIRRHEEIRQRSVFTWFPAFQLFLLIPIITFIFKRQKPWFYFARMVSFFIVFPGTLMVIYFTLL
ncbi:MAG: hypothetical protein QNK23_15445 [Crocinitomicaceae bacterium]|nr:hypothetical protein [Crocinitomicaceae bacterium]